MCIDEAVALSMEDMACHMANPVSGRKKRASADGLAHILASRRWTPPILYSIDTSYSGKQLFTHYTSMGVNNTVTMGATKTGTKGDYPSGADPVWGDAFG